MDTDEYCQHILTELRAGGEMRIRPGFGYLLAPVNATRRVLWPAPIPAHPVERLIDEGLLTIHEFRVVLTDAGRAA